MACRPHLTLTFPFGSLRPTPGVDLVDPGAQQLCLAVRAVNAILSETAGA